MRNFIKHIHEFKVKHLLHHKKTQVCTNKLSQEEIKRNIIVFGKAGIGKTNIVREYIKDKPQLSKRLLTEIKNQLKGV